MNVPGRMFSVPFFAGVIYVVRCLKMVHFPILEYFGGYGPGWMLLYFYENGY